MLKELIELQRKVKRGNVKASIGFGLLSISTFSAMIYEDNNPSLNDFFILSLIITFGCFSVLLIRKMSMFSKSRRFLWYFFNKKTLSLMEKVYLFLDEEDSDIFNISNINLNSYTLIENLLNFNLNINIINNNQDLVVIKKGHDQYHDLLLYNKVALSKSIVDEEIKRIILKNHKILYKKCRDIIENLSKQYKDAEHLNTYLTKEEVKENYKILEQYYVNQNSIEIDIFKEVEEIKNSLCSKIQSEEHRKHLSL